jgi:hypothetical protein
LNPHSFVSDSNQGSLLGKGLLQDQQKYRSLLSEEKNDVGLATISNLSSLSATLVPSPQFGNERRVLIHRKGNNSHER